MRSWRLVAIVLAISGCAQVVGVFPKSSAPPPAATACEGASCAEAVDIAAFGGIDDPTPTTEGGGSAGPAADQSGQAADQSGQAALSGADAIPDDDALRAQASATLAAAAQSATDARRTDLTLQAPPPTLEITTTPGVPGPPTPLAAIEPAAAPTDLPRPRPEPSDAERARLLVERGLDAAATRRFADAMRLFNEAWSEDRAHFGVFAGFGVVALARDGDAETASAFFGEARVRAEASRDRGQEPERLAAAMDVLEAQALCLADEIDAAFRLLSRAAERLGSDSAPARTALEACESGATLALNLP